MLHYLTGNKYNKQITVNDLIRYNACILRRNVYVINIYRPTIERKISEYFEQLSEVHFNRSEEDLAKFPISVLISRFNRICPYIENGDHYFEKYDIPAESRIKQFDHEKKYVHHRVLMDNANVNYVLLRLQDANTHWSLILSGIFGRPVTIISENKRTTLQEKYIEFQREYEMPENYMKYVKDEWSKYYMEEEEQEKYVRKYYASDTGKPLSESEKYKLEDYQIYERISQENRIGLESKLRNNYKEYQKYIKHPTPISTHISTPTQTHTHTHTQTPKLLLKVKPTTTKNTQKLQNIFKELQK
jgi:hypothetical protein